MPQVLEPELLQTFVAIVDTGSFTRAAGRVCRTQSAVSMQMKRLEEVIGRPLIDRTVGKMLLTPDGELLLCHARRILQAHQQALAPFGASRLSESVVLGCPDDHAQSLLPPILSWFAEKYPEVKVDVVCEPTERLLKLLQAGSVDAALVTQGFGDYSGIVVHREPLVWVTSMQHHAHEQDPLPLALCSSPRSPFRLAAREALTTCRRDSKLVYTTESIAGIEATVHAGLAVSVLAKHTVPAHLRILTECDEFPPLPSVSIAFRRAADKTWPALDYLEQHVSRIPLQRDALFSAASPFP
jgi:DNA-binding transcriptional LysR family regulator